MLCAWQYNVVRLFSGKRPSIIRGKATLAYIIAIWMLSGQAVSGHPTWRRAKECQECSVQRAAWLSMSSSQAAFPLPFMPFMGAGQLPFTPIAVHCAGGKSPHPHRQRRAGGPRRRLGGVAI